MNEGSERDIKGIDMNIWKLGGEEIFNSFYKNQFVVQRHWLSNIVLDDNKSLAENLYLLSLYKKEVGSCHN